MVEIDYKSLLATTDTDVMVEEIEELLNKEGYTLNYFAVPHNQILLADVLNDRVPNLYEDAFGGIEDICVGIRIARPDGEIFENLLTPRSATGPNLKKLSIGSEEWLGIPIQATLRISPLPAKKLIAAIRFPGKRRRGFFLQALRRNRTPLPLAIPLSEASVREFFPDLEDGWAVVAFSYWGEKSQMPYWEHYLKDLAISKKGEWIHLDKWEFQEQMWNVLHEEGAIIKTHQIQEALTQLSSSHRQLMKIVMEVH